MIHGQSVQSEQWSIDVCLDVKKKVESVVNQEAVPLYEEECYSKFRLGFTSMNQYRRRYDDGFETAVYSIISVIFRSGLSESYWNGPIKAGVISQNFSNFSNNLSLFLICLL